MESAVRLAISKIKDDGSREHVAPGKYKIDEIVRVKGILKVNEDYKRRTIMSLPHTEVLALALHLSGVQQDNAIKSIRNAVQQVLSQGDSAVGAVKDLIPKIEEEIKRIKEEIVNSLPEQECKGNVTFTEYEVTSVDAVGSIAEEANNILQELLEA